MSLSQHRKVVENSQEVSEEFKQLFNRLGSLDNPNGKVYAAYRTSRRALRGNLGKPRTVNEILMTMRDAVEASTGKVLQASVDVGEKKAEFERKVYGLPAPKDQNVNIKPQLTSVMAAVDNQITSVKSAVAIGMDEATILGNANQVGLLTPAPVTREADRWIVALAVITYAGLIRSSLRATGAASDFVRQAVAVLDQKTTNTCLQVHGQVTGMGEAFKLEGEPRFANEMDEPPFHYNCRTGVVIVKVEDAEDRFTDDLINERTEELKRIREEEEGRVSERIGNA